MPNTMTLISSTTVGAGGASSINFTSIPQTYTDLCLKVSIRGSRPTNVYSTINIAFNSSTSNLTSILMQGSGSAASSSSYATIIPIDMVGEGATANTFGNGEFYIPNYTGSTYKSISTDAVSENNATLTYSNLSAGLWSNTAAITSINLTAGIYSFLQYCTAYLYGIKNS